MNGVCWRETNDRRVNQVAAPKSLSLRRFIVERTTAVISGFNSQSYDGYVLAIDARNMCGQESINVRARLLSVVSALKIPESLSESLVRKRCLSDCWSDSYIEKDTTIAARFC